MIGLHRLAQLTLQVSLLRWLSFQKKTVFLKFQKKTASQWLNLRFEWTPVSAYCQRFGLRAPVWLNSISLQFLWRSTELVNTSLSDRSWVKWSGDASRKLKVCRRMLPRVIGELIRRQVTFNSIRRNSIVADDTSASVNPIVPSESKALIHWRWLIGSLRFLKKLSSLLI